MRRLDDVGLKAEDAVARLGVIGALFHPRAVLLELLLGQGRQELEERRKAVFLLDDAVDRHVVDAEGRWHLGSLSKNPAGRLIVARRRTMTKPLSGRGPIRRFNPGKACSNLA